jgi:N-methylhydantoinase B/oxoprolinase/acetone carboxylase alpha subunit
MAEAAIGFAASIAGLAAFGIQIVTTLNTFATSYARAEQQIKDLSADVALTASILESIGKMIREYEDQFHLTVENYIATRDQCERNFRTLWTALKVVKK